MSLFAFLLHSAVKQRASRRAEAPLILLRRSSLELFQGTRWGGKLINHHCSAKENFASLPLTVLLISRQRETLRKAFADGNRLRAAPVQGSRPPLDVKAGEDINIKGLAGSI